MVLYDDKSSIIENQTFKVTGLTCMGRMTSPKETVDAPLKPVKMRPGFSKADEEYPICL